MRIAYITNDNPHSLSGWSGTTHFIGRSLKDAGNELIYIHEFDIRSNFVFWIKQKLYPKFTGKFIQPQRYPAINKQYTSQINKQLDKVNTPEFLFSNSSEMIAACSANIPMAFWVDACFAGMLDYYTDFSLLHPETISRANALEQKAYDNAARIFFSSEWAAKTAQKHYNIDSNKIKVVPFGANVTFAPEYDEIKKIISRKTLQKINLLFIGVYWERKGGPLALEVTKKLNDLNIEATLTIVGCTPFSVADKPDFVNQPGFLNKEDEVQNETFQNLLRDSHFLILPSKAECYGLVYAEANAYGLPVLGTKTGGIPTIIENEINGQLFETHAPADDYAEYIIRLHDHLDQYLKLSEGALEAYHKRLNWKVAGQAVTQELKKCLKH